MTKINPFFAEEIKKYGAEDFQSCFNCGNCTAICTLSGKDAAFPRMMIRYGMLGMKDEILGSTEPWLCYSCGDCSETCPRQADPGHYMSALRRYTIANYEPTGLTRLLFKSNPAAVVITILLAVILGGFLFTLKPEFETARWLFRIFPFAVIHDMGLVIFNLTGISVLAGIIAMVSHLSKTVDKSVKRADFGKAIKSVLSELVTLKRYRDCDKEEDSVWFNKPFYVKPWFLHWSVMWGFIGLLLATVLDFILKDPATNIWWPSRILGTLSGLFLIYGTTIIISYRIKKITKVYSETRLADWMFVVFLWVAGLTGFWLEISVAFQADYIFNHIIFLIHTIISMELVLLFAFSKFAHAFYRPLALFFFYRRKG